jgi:hypothetical protein
VSAPTVGGNASSRPPPPQGNANSSASQPDNPCSPSNAPPAKRSALSNGATVLCEASVPFRRQMGRDVNGCEGRVAGPSGPSAALLRRSFVLPGPIRDLRDLTGSRRRLLRDGRGLLHPPGRPRPPRSCPARSPGGHRRNQTGRRLTTYVGLRPTPSRPTSAAVVARVWVTGVDDGKRLSGPWRLLCKAH